MLQLLCKFKGLRHGCLRVENFQSVVSALTKITLMFQALDTFNTAVVSPIYYVMFTTLTILASVIMFKVF